MQARPNPFSPRRPSAAASPSNSIAIAASPAIMAAEEGLLATLLKESEGLEGLPALHSSDFSNPTLGVIYQTIQELSEDAATVDPVSVAARLEARGIDTKAVINLGQIVSASPGAASTYASEILSASRRRKITAASVALAADPENLDLAEQLQRAREYGVSGKGLVTSSEAVDAVIDLIQRRHEGRDPVCSTGLRELDALLNGGFRAGQMIVIGGRPGEGKSVLAQGIAEANGYGGKVVLHISLEMEAAEVVERRLVACSKGEISPEALKTGHLSESELAELERLAPILRDSSVRYLATESATIERILALATAVAATEEVGLVIVDYLQLAESGLSTEIREQHVAMVSRKLKQLAMRLKAPVIALSQLNRKAEPGRRPQLSDLRESGAIEQDADIVLFIHADDPDQSSRELVVAKHRGGRKGSVPAKWLPHQLRFDDAAQATVQAPSAPTQAVQSGRPSELDQIVAYGQGRMDVVDPVLASQLKRIGSIRSKAAAVDPFAIFGG